MTGNYESSTKRRRRPPPLFLYVGRLYFRQQPSWLKDKTNNTALVDTPTGFRLRATSANQEDRPMQVSLIERGQTEIFCTEPVRPRSQLVIEAGKTDSIVGDFRIRA